LPRFEPGSLGLPNPAMPLLLMRNINEITNKTGPKDCKWSLYLLVLLQMKISLEQDLGPVTTDFTQSLQA
jgi:hypothetical protein